MSTADLERKVEPTLGHGTAGDRRLEHTYLALVTQIVKLGPRLWREDIG